MWSLLAVARVCPSGLETHRELLRERARLLRLPLEITGSAIAASEQRPGALRVLHIPLAEPATPGKLEWRTRAMF